MVTFKVSDMTCGHCAGTIARAVAGVDRDARLDVRLQQKLVRIDSTASAAELAQAIQEAGYTPQEVRQEASGSTAPRVAGAGCGCGSKPAAIDPRQEAAAAGGAGCR